MYLLKIKKIEELISELENNNLSAEEKCNLYVKIADAYSHLKLHKEAIEYYSYAIDINNLYGYTYYLRGNIYFLLEDSENCINDYIRYLNLITRINYDELMFLAKIFATIKKYKYAISCYIRAISINNNSKEIYKELADLYTELGDFTNAYKYYECSLKLDNNYYDAHACRLVLFLKYIDNISDGINIETLFYNIISANNLIKKLKNYSIDYIKYIEFAIIDIDTILHIEYDNDLVQLKDTLIKLIRIINEK